MMTFYNINHQMLTALNYKHQPNLMYYQKPEKSDLHTFLKKTFNNK